MRRLAIVGLGLLSVLLASCGSAPPPPEGFTIAVRFVVIDPAILERLEISFRPQGGARFEEQTEMSFEGGAITTRVEDDGTLTLNVTGDHVRANVRTTDTGQRFYDLHIWSEDEAMRAGPQMFGVAYRSGAAIGDGGAFLPVWPPPVEEDGACTGSTCTTQLAITCFSTMPERCSP
jgi:hypothetical protein